MVQKIQKCSSEYHRWKLLKTDFCCRQDAWKQSWRNHAVRSRSEIIWYYVLSEFGIWYCSEYSYKKLKYWRTHWIPHTLTAEQCAVLVATCKKNLTCFWKEGCIFLNQMVIGDKSWCHYHTPICKQSSLTRKHKNLSHETKTRSKTSAGKVMLRLFFDIFVPILVEWMTKGTTINAARYVDTLVKLRVNVKNCQKGK